MPPRARQDNSGPEQRTMQTDKGQGGGKGVYYGPDPVHGISPPHTNPEK